MTRSHAPTHPTQPRLARAAIVALVAALPACDEAAAGTGDVSVRASAQDFVKTGWPTMDGDELVEFADGWDVKFDHVIVGLSAFRLSEGEDEVVAEDPKTFLVDLRAGDVDLWMLADVPAQRWSDIGYRLTAPTKQTEIVGDIDDDLVKEAREEGYSIWIQGHGEKDDREVRFSFGIPHGVVTSRCLNGMDETDGAIVREGRINELEITLHMDHLFWDDHDAEEPRLLFGPLARAAGDDDLVTLDELASQRLADLEDENGDPLVDEDGTPIVYVPRVELSDNDLREYMIDTALTLGHFNGEGHCEYEVGD